MQSVAEGEREPAVPAEGRTTMDRWNVGILIFDGVEVLDFAGPFEVFSRTRLTPGSDSRRSDDSAPFSVFTVAKSLFGRAVADETAHYIEYRRVAA